MKLSPCKSRFFLAGPPSFLFKKKKVIENGVGTHDEDPEIVVDGETVLNGDEHVRNGEEDNVDNEGDDEAEAALKNEEEREFHRIKELRSILG